MNEELKEFLRTAEGHTKYIGAKVSSDYIFKLVELCRRQHAALEPFAACEVFLHKNIDPKDTWLWKPSQTSKELAGISVQNILDAKAMVNVENI